MPEIQKYRKTLSIKEKVAAENAMYSQGQFSVGSYYVNTLSAMWLVNIKMKLKCWLQPTFNKVMYVQTK